MAYFVLRIAYCVLRITLFLSLSKDSVFRMPFSVITFIEIHLPQISRHHEPFSTRLR